MLTTALGQFNDKDNTGDKSTYRLSMIFRYLILNHKELEQKNKEQGILNDEIGSFIFTNCSISLYPLRNAQSSIFNIQCSG